MKFDTVSLAVDHINASHHPAWALSPYLDIVRETRYIFLDDTLLLAYDKIPIEKNGLLFFNLSQGASAVTINADADTAEYARTAHQALGLIVSAVDCVTLADGTQLILEVNSSPGLDHYAQLSPAHRAGAEQAYTSILDYVTR